MLKEGENISVNLKKEYQTKYNFMIRKYMINKINKVRLPKTSLPKNFKVAYFWVTCKEIQI